MRKYSSIEIAISVGVILLLVLALVIILGYIFNWSWAGLSASTSPHPTVVLYQPGKTLWDWLQLLIIPVALAVGGFIFNRMIQSREQKRTTDYQEAAVLQSYLDNMSELLLNKPLLGTSEADTMRKK